MRYLVPRPLVTALVLVMCLALLGVGVSQAGPAPEPAAQGAPSIYLRAGTFTPAAGQQPAIPPGLAKQGYAPGERGTYIVQFQGPIEQNWKDAIEKENAEVLEYIPDFAFKVRMSPGEAKQVEQVAGVIWVGVFQPAFKIDPQAAKDETQRIYTVLLEKGGDRGKTVAALKQAGLQVVEQSPNQLQIVADAAQVAAVAHSVDVAWIETYQPVVKHNDVGAGSIIGTAIANANGYDGSTQIAAVADTGIGGGTAATAHRDIPAPRVQGIYNWPGVTDSCFQTITNDGAVDVDSGHGAHVSGSILSGGDPGGFGKGGAPAAKLVFQATENWVKISSLCKALYGYTDGYYLTGLNNLSGLFQEAYNAGARVHSNSWGSAAAGAYNANSQTADQFMWNNKDMLITFSAGNEGADANADGVVDSGSIGAPATAKNVLAVGASENARPDNYPCDSSLSYTSHDTTYQNGQTCGSMGGVNLLGTPRQRWGFTANPIADDPTAGNQEQMAAFSSRGPVDDGRIKPDVVAPGTWILSTYSDMYQEGYGDPVNPKNSAYQLDGWGLPRNGFYKYFGGTSMSNPIAAGGAVVVRDFYQKVHSLNASAALVKATLINSAVDMLDENNDGVNDNAFPIPNVHEGWGRVNIANATDGSARFVDQTAGLSTGGSRTYSATTGGGAALKITVVWSDYPSSTSAATNLVNDLDVEVRGPGGAPLYLGNVFSGGWSQTGGSADRKNNVENVYISAAAAGTWTITVKGFNVPNGPQPFALVVDGATALADTTPAVPAAPSSLTATAISRTQINLAWTDNANDETGFKIERCSGSNCTNFVQVATVGANVTSYSNTGLTRNTTYRYRVRATNGSGDSAYSNIASAKTLR